jgi:hypothetical protein
MMLAIYAVLVLMVYFKGEPEKILPDPQMNATVTSDGEKMLNKMKKGLEVKIQA